MNILTFPQPPHSQSWQAAEMQALTGACAAFVSSGEASGWEVGETEQGDPQLYVLGPPPERDCVLCVSRLGRLYVLENGEGRVLFENDSLIRLAERMRATLRRRKGAIIARIAFAWCVARETIEEKVEPIVAGPAEFLVHVAPQLTALA